MSILVILGTIFLALFILGLILKVAIWLIWLFIILAVVSFLARLIRRGMRKMDEK